jgi:predicted nucleic acid-binding protein
VILALPAMLVLDANILIRAVLGKKVRQLLMEFSDIVDFFIPDICMEDAKIYLPDLLKKRNIPSESAIAVLNNLEPLLHITDKNFYTEYEVEARHRMQNRDVDDWPIVATALLLNCPIWTEDKDFFGSGLPTWTTDRIHLFFAAHKKIHNSSNEFQLNLEYHSK